MLQKDKDKKNKETEFKKLNLLSQLSWYFVVLSLILPFIVTLISLDIDPSLVSLVFLIGPPLFTVSAIRHGRKAKSKKNEIKNLENEITTLNEKHKRLQKITNINIK